MQNPQVLAQIKAPVLVLGATGRIGTVLRRCWPKNRALWQTRRTIPDQDGPWVQLDPLDSVAGPEALVRAATGRSVILCLAGVVPGQGGLGQGGLGQGGAGQGEQPPALSDNTALAEAAIRAAQAVGARVILASSAAVYGNQPGLLGETAPLCPMSDYGRAKAAMEARAAELGAELGVPVTSLRIGNIAGIDAILGGWQPGFRLDQFPDGRTPQRSYIGLVTLARVLGDLVAPDTLPEILNVATPGTVEMGALLDAAGLVWTPRAAPEGAIARVCLSTRALERFTPLSEADGTASAMVAEWRSLQE